MHNIIGVVNLHREGRISVASIRSAIAAARVANNGVTKCKILLVLDNPDEITSDIANSFVSDDVELLYVDEKDLGRSRNAAVLYSRDADYIAFLDGDDLWDDKWLASGYRALVAANAPVVAHPRYTICFGGSNEIWVSVDSCNPEFNFRALRVLNYWTALSYAHRDIYLEHQYNPNELRVGWGYEDWEWNCRTLAGGIHHIAVADGVHFVRKRQNSLSRASLANRVLVRPTSFARYHLPHTVMEALSE